jgi:hypothetical protein
MNPDLQTQIDELRAEINALKAQATIPYDVEQAFINRLNIRSFTPLTVGSKALSSENQSVNEAGSATYSVLKTPKGWLQVIIANTAYYIPYFT